MWRYASGGDRHGPVSEEDIAALIASGEIGPTSYVREEGGDEWREARHTALARYFRAAAMASAKKQDARRLREMRRAGGGAGNWIGGAVTVAFLVIVVGGGVWVSQGGFSRAVEGTPVERYVPAAFLSDEALARRLEAEFERQPIYREMRSLPRFKALFPDEYHALLRELAPLYRRNATHEQAEAAAEQHMRGFIERSKGLLVRASPEALSEFLSTEAAVFQAMRQNNVAVCAVAIDGGGSASEFGRALAANDRAELDALNVAMLEAIRSGQTVNNVYAPMTAEDWTALGRALLANGMKPEMLQQFSANPRLLSPADKCGVVAEMFAAMSREPDINQRARYAADIVRHM
jgi:hypothetical protein